jgi:hypothetical protein
MEPLLFETYDGGADDLGSEYGRGHQDKYGPILACPCVTKLTIKMPTVHHLRTIRPFPTPTAHSPLGSDKPRFASPASRSSPGDACRTAAWPRDSRFPTRRIPLGRAVVHDLDRVAAGDGDYAAGEVFGVEDGSGDGGLRSLARTSKVA